MTSTDQSTSRPFTRNRSSIVHVKGEFAGGTVVYEVMTAEWLNNQTARYRRVWSARQTGALGWSAGSTARLALMGAACLRGRVRQSWLTTAAAEAEKALQ